MSFWCRRNCPISQLQEQLSTVDEESVNGIQVASRDIGSISIISQPSEIETLLANVSSPYDDIDFNDAALDVEPDTLVLLKNGCSLQDLVNSSPDDVLTVLKDMVIAKQGSFKAKDSEILRAFGRCAVLTRTSDQADDPFWETNWRDYMRQRISKRIRNQVSVGWEERVSLTAYVVLLKDFANFEEGDLITLLLKKSSSGATAKTVWEIPAVRALVNYHWYHWARRCLFYTSYFFVIWAFVFAIYVGIYIEARPAIDSCRPQGNENGTATTPEELEKEANSTFDTPEVFIPSDNLHMRLDTKRSSEEGGPTVELPPCHGRIYGAFSHNPALAVATHVANAICFACSFPFLIHEIWSIFALGWRWLQLQNLIDVITYLVQAIIFILHVTDTILITDYFGTLLAIQTVVLSFEILRFLRLLGEGATLLDSAFEVIYAVRLWILYIIVAGVSASLCLGALYDRDTGFHKKQEDFKTLKAALVTTFQIVFGDFDVHNIFDADYPWVKFFFFFAFQLIMTITVLNLLIAVMSEAYSTVAEEKTSQLCRGRAQVISEMNILPFTKLVKPVPRTYLHFLVVENERKKPTSLSQIPSLVKRDPAPDDLKHEIKVLSEKMDEMAAALKILSEANATRSEST